MMHELFDQLADVITASSSRLGLVALMVILAGFLAYKFFANRSENVQLKVFGSFGVALTLLAFLVLVLPAPSPNSLVEEPTNEEDPQGDTEAENGESGEETDPDTTPSPDGPAENGGVHGEQGDPSTDHEPTPEPTEPIPTPPPPPPPSPIEAWIHGVDFRRALELAGGKYEILDGDNCKIYNEETWVTARVKAGLVGNKCEFRFHQGPQLHPACRITEWDLGLPASNKHRWITHHPRPGNDPLFQFRIWADIPGSKIHLRLRRVRVQVPASTAVVGEEIDGEAFFRACLG